MRDSWIVPFGDWTLRVSQPQEPASSVFFMLHGWKGNEDVMWIFADRLPKNALLIAPRAIYSVPDGGYSWVQEREETLSGGSKFEPAIQALDRLAEWSTGEFRADWSRRHLIGFSQGAALTYAWLFAHPKWFNTAAGLAGFVPHGLERENSLLKIPGKKIFAAHGIRDDVVPVERMREDVRRLEAAGARVTFCEDDTGHKIGSVCLRALKDFYST